MRTGSPTRRPALVVLLALALAALGARPIPARASAATLYSGQWGSPGAEDG